MFVGFDDEGMMGFCGLGILDDYDYIFESGIDILDYR